MKTLLLIFISSLVEFGYSSIEIHSPTNLTTVAPHQYPYIVYLQFDDGSSSCGGTLVTRRFILTSSKCAYTKRQRFFTAYLGAHDINNIDPSRTELIQGDRIFFHDNYVFSNTDDIALAKLLFEANLSKFIKLVGFPPLRDAAKNLIGSNCVVVGWGSNNLNDIDKMSILQQEHVTIINNLNCSKKTKRNITSKQFCTHIDTMGSCRDIGGPLICDGHLQVGIVATHTGNCVDSDGFYTTYTKVSDYLEWIFNTIRYNS